MYKREKFGLLFLLCVFGFAFLMIKEIHPDAQMYPYIVCTLGLFLTSLQLAITLYKEKKNIPIGGDAPLTPTQIRYLVVALGSTCLYIFTANVVGFFTTTFLYVIIFSYWHTNTHKKWLYVLVAVCMNIAIYIAFKIFLGVPLPTGLLF